MHSETDSPKQSEHSLNDFLSHAIIQRQKKGESDQQSEGFESQDEQKELFKGSVVDVNLIYSKGEFLEQNSDSLSTEFLTSVEKMMKSSKPEHIFVTLVKVNEHCLFHMANELKMLRHNKSIEQASENYEVLERQIQKAEREVRKHIGVEHEMKVYIDELEEKTQALENSVDSQAKQIRFYQKQLAQTKKEQIQLSQELEFLRGQNSALNKLVKLNESKRKSLQMHRLNTQGSSALSNDHSKKSIMKASCHHKSNIASRKTSNAKLLSHSINVNLQNYLTATQEEKGAEESAVPDKKKEVKDIFWNRRIKRKQAEEEKGPKILRQSQKESPKAKAQCKKKQLISAYQSNVARHRYHTVIDEDMATHKMSSKKKDRRLFEVSRSLINRAKSVVN